MTWVGSSLNQKAITTKEPLVSKGPLLGKNRFVRTCKNRFVRTCTTIEGTPLPCLRARHSSTVFPVFRRLATTMPSVAGPTSSTRIPHAQERGDPPLPWLQRTEFQTTVAKHFQPVASPGALSPRSHWVLCQRKGGALREQSHLGFQALGLRFGPQPVS